MSSAQLSLDISHSLLPPATAYLVVDLESTCSRDGSVPRLEMETIEIGAILIRGTDLQEIARFQTFVRPQRHPKLTDFCKDLTHITQKQVDSAPSFSEAIHQFEAKLFPKPKGIYFCSWSDFDRVLFVRDCQIHAVPYPFPPHFDLKPAFAKCLGQERNFGLRHAMDICDLEFEGQQHRGLDDAINTARLLPFIKDTRLGRSTWQAYRNKPRRERRLQHAKRWRAKEGQS